MKVLWRQWQKNAVRIWRQSKSSFLILAISQIVLGLMPYLAVVWFGGFVDAISGARSLGLWIDELDSRLWMLLAFIALFAVTMHTTRQFKGASASVARGIRWGVFLLSILIVLLPVAPVMISITGLLLFAEIWIEKRVRLLLWLVVIACIAWLQWSLIESIVFQAFTMGEGLSLAAFVLMIPARQFIDRYFVCE